MEKPLDILKLEAEIAKLIVESGKLVAEAVKFNAEAIKMRHEARWYPGTWATAFAGAVLTLARLCN